MKKRIFEYDGIWKAKNHKRSIIFEVRRDNVPTLDWTYVGKPLGLDRREKIRRMSKCLLRFEEDGITVLTSLLKEIKK